MKKPPELLKHDAILTNWRSYPEGSIERAKAIGIELLATCTNLEVTIQLWESKCDIVAKEQAWKPLGLKSREDFIKAVTGRSESVVRKKISAAESARAMRAADPTMTQTEIARELGVTKQAVHKSTKTFKAKEKVDCPDWMRGDAAKATFRKLTPEDQERVRAAGRGSLRGIAIAAGIVKVPTVLDRLRTLWAKASEPDRRAFMEEITDGR